MQIGNYRYVQNNACHQRKKNIKEIYRRAALTTVSCTRNLQVDRNQSEKKTFIVFICLEIEKIKLKKNKQTKNQQQQQLKNTTAMQNKFDFGSVGFNVVLAKVPLKSMFYLYTEQLKYGLW